MTFHIRNEVLYYVACDHTVFMTKLLKKVSKNFIGSTSWFLQIKLLTMLLLFDGFIMFIL